MNINNNTLLTTNYIYDYHFLIQFSIFNNKMSFTL